MLLNFELADQKRFILRDHHAICWHLLPSIEMQDISNEQIFLSDEGVVQWGSLSPNDVVLILNEGELFLVRGVNVIGYGGAKKI